MSVREARSAAGSEPAGSARLLRAAVLGMFCASGAAGLVLEVVWARMLGVVFGNTVYAAGTVLAAFMLGLAVGSAWLGGRADRVRRPLMFYGWLEIGVGVYAMAMPLLAGAALAGYGWFYRTAAPGFALLSAVRVAMSLLLLLPPTILMGGTLPALSRHLAARRDRPGQQVGYLYSANTLGAIAGCFLAGFVLLEALGVRVSLTAAGCAAIVVGGLAVVLGRRAEDPVAPAVIGKPSAKAGPPGGEGGLTAGTFRLVLIAYGVAGFCALAYEVLWTRVLLFVMATSVYSFATMLTAFLAGLAIGSFLSARWLVPRIRRGVLWFGAVELLVGAAALASVPILARLEAVDFRWASWLAGAGRTGMLLARFGDAAAVLLVPTLLMGAAMPIVMTCCLAGPSGLGRRVGQVYAANTVGCVLGALSAGFVLIPLMGMHRSLLAVASVNLAVAVVLVWRGGLRSAAGRVSATAAAAALAVGAIVLTPADVFHRTINAFHHPSRISFLREHSTGTVSVHELPNGGRLIATDGVNVAGTSFMLRSTQKLQGYIPLLLHPNPRRVVQIGFGSGETARVGLQYGVERYTVVEICPAVFDAGEHFTDINAGSHRDARVRRIIMDGKNFARLSDEKFDLVMNDSTFPGSSGSSALYTVDHFRACRRRLDDGGLFSCWVPLDLRPGELRMILASFQRVFPHCSLWVASNCVNKHALILGSLERMRISFARVRAAMSRPDVAADLKAVAIHDVYDLLDCHVCDAEAIRRMTRDDPPNTDDRPRLEFSCALPSPPMGALWRVLAMLVGHRRPVTPYVADFADPAADRAELDRRFRATRHVFQAQIAQIVGDPPVRRRQFQLALAAHPAEAHVMSCEAELRQEIEDLIAAVARPPHSDRLVLRLADKLYVASRYAEAAPLYEKLAEAARPAAPAVLIHLAEIRHRIGYPEEAERLLRRCLSIWPDSADAHDRLAGICLRTGRHDRARRHLTEAIRLDPTNNVYRAHLKALDAAGRAKTPAPPP